VREREEEEDEKRGHGTMLRDVALFTWVMDGHHFIASLKHTKFI